MEKGEARQLRAVSKVRREESGGQRESWTDPNSQSQEQSSQRRESCPGGGGTWAIRLPPESEESHLVCLMQRSRWNRVTGAKAPPPPTTTHIATCSRSLAGSGQWPSHRTSKQP